MYVPVALVRRVNSGEDGEEVEPVVHCMKWGLVPSFTKKNEKPDHYKMVCWLILGNYIIFFPSFESLNLIGMQHIKGKFCYLNQFDSHSWIQFHPIKL